MQEGQERVEDEQHPGRSSTSTDEKHVKEIKDLLLKNRRSTMRELADTIRISKGLVDTILKDVLCLRRIKSQSVPKTLNLSVTIWPKIQPISFHNHCISLIWHRVICGYSVLLQDCFRNTVLSPLKIFSVNRCVLRRPSQKRTIRTVLKIKKMIFHLINKFTLFFGHRSII